MSGSGEVSEEDIAVALEILDRTGARARIAEALAGQGALARSALSEGARRSGRSTARSAYRALESLLDFVLATR